MSRHSGQAIKHIMEFERKKTQTTLRVDDELYKFISAFAKTKGISFNAQAEMIISDFLTDYQENGL